MPNLEVLSVWQREVVALAPANEWFAASDLLGPRAGNSCSVLADKGFFERRSDPRVWGRSQYRKVAP